MKETITERENKRVNQVKKELREKEKKILQNKRYYATEGNTINKIKKIREEKAQKALEQHEEILESYEKKRLKEEKRTNLKLKEFEDNLNEIKKKRNISYNDKLKQSYNEHIKNLKIRDEKYEQLMKERDDKFIHKYTQAYWSHREKVKSLNQKKNNREKHFEYIKEMREEQDKIQLKKVKKFQKKLNEMNKRREQIEQRKKEDTHKLQEIQKERFERVKDNLINNKNEDEEVRLNILDYQREMVFNRAEKKDNAIESKKNNARETIVLDNMEREAKIAQFNKDIFKLQNKSMLKLSERQRKDLYKNLLREEAEKKKKEEEDRKYKQ
jgi:hypothetical protein